MTVAPAEPDVDAASAPLADEVRWQLDTLKELGDLGMRLARASVAEAEARAAAPDAAPAKPNDPALAFSRLGRAVRLTVMLHARILAGDLGRVADAPAEAAAQAREAEEALEDRRVTGRLRRSMTQYIAATAINAEAREPAEQERLFEALSERLDREGSDEADFADIEIMDLAYAIARDLGVDPGPDWWMEAWAMAAPNDPSPKRPSPERGRRAPCAEGEWGDGVTDAHRRAPAAPP